MENAFRYVIDHGITTSKSYSNETTSGCKYKPSMEAYKIKSCANTFNSTSGLMSALFAQPVSVVIDASGSAFILYKSGVFSGSCGININHGVLATGYGSLNGKKYWRIQNSWGTTWGDHGYINLMRHDTDGHGQCGVLIWNTVPLQSVW